MEATLLNSSTEKSVSSYKQLGKAKRENRSLNSSSNFHGGILHAPPPLSLSYSYPPPHPLSVFQQNHQQQPPLLPLPIPKQNNNPRNRGVSCPPVNRKINNKPRPKAATALGLGPKKGDTTKQQPFFGPKAATALGPKKGDSGKPLGPDPSKLPAEVYGVFALSPPPSSLPLPTFSLRPKLACKAEAAAGIDAGATDNLRRILRLR